MLEVRETRSVDIGPGYDAGYRACRNFWGREPARNVVRAADLLPPGFCVDLGCGEGKNAAYVASLGFEVVAVDSSRAALSNAAALFGEVRGIEWIKGDALECLKTEKRKVDLAICTGMAHCLGHEEDLSLLFQLCAQRLTDDGLLVFSAFNGRRQELEGHEPHFRPLLVPHDTLVLLAHEAGLAVLKLTDCDLLDNHPHIGIPHHHSITRFIAAKRAVRF